MPRLSSRYPTELELEILKVLWAKGTCSVREIQEALSGTRGHAYTTVSTMITIMASKGYVRRAKGAGAVYEAVLEQDDASADMLQDIVQRVFDGSVPAVVQQLLETADLDAAELDAIRKLITKKQKEHKS